MYEMKSPRQVSYVPKSTELVDFRHHAENPHVLGVGLKVHSATRSKQLVDYFHANSVSVPYARILRVETQLAEAVIQRMALTSGVYIPPGLKKGKFVFFAVDNVDFSSYTMYMRYTLRHIKYCHIQCRLEPPTPLD